MEQLEVSGTSGGGTASEDMSKGASVGKTKDVSGAYFCFLLSLDSDPEIMIYMQPCQTFLYDWEEWYSKLRSFLGLANSECPT
jgi:hypothetical protein